MRVARRQRSSTSRIAVLLALSVVLSGCFWSQPGFDGRRTGFNPHERSLTSANVASLTERWSVPGGGGSQLVTSSGRVHVGSPWPGGLSSYDSTDGSLVWSTPIDVGDVGNPPLLVGSGGRLVVPVVEAGDPTGCILQIDPATGNTEACATLLAPPDSTGLLHVEAVRDGEWIVVTYSYPTAAGWGSAIAATNLSNPALRWIVELRADTETLISNPVVVDGVVYVAFGAPTPGVALLGWDVAQACTPDCGPSVEHDLPSAIVSGISADPTGSTIAVVTNDGLLVVDRATGDLLWTGTYPVDGSYDHRSIPTWTPAALVVPVATRIDRPFLGQTYATAVVAFPVGGCGAPTCPATWSAELLGRPAGQAAAAGDVVYVASEYAFAAFPTECTGTCEPLYLREEEVWTWFGPPIVSTGFVLHAPNGDLQALSLP